MSRKFRVLSLLAEAAHLELEEILEKDSEYEREFREDFSEVTSFLLEKEDQKRKFEAFDPNFRTRLPNNTDASVGEIHSKSAKEIYRSLAKKTHPDVAGEELTEEFKEIQNAYNSGDLIGLMIAANRHEISVI